MWELIYSTTRHALRTRTLSLFTTLVIVVSFTLSLVIASPALAEDVTWSGSNLTYQGKTFAPAADIQAGDPRLSGAQFTGTHVYEYVNTVAKTLEVLYIDKATDPSVATKATYVTYSGFSPPNTFSSQSPPSTVSLAKQPATVMQQAASSGNASTASSCDPSVYGGIGWVACSVANSLASAVDGLYGLISKFLIVTTLTADKSGSVFKVWQVVVSIANVCFIFAFLCVIYVHLTSYDIEKYNLFKKMLPRLLIAAILVNTSYWICAAGVDLSNFLGYSVERLFAGVRDSIGVSSAAVAISWKQVTAFILSAGATGLVGFAVATGGSIASLGFILLSLLVTVAFSAMVAFLILSARQAIIIVLIAVSPLAFVAWTLPVTEKYFKKWADTFMTMLLIFPIFSAIYGGAMLAGLVIINGANGNIVTILLGMGVQIVPLAVTPILIRFSTGILGQVAHMANDRNRGVADRTRNWAKANADHHANRKRAKNDNLVGKNPLNLANPARLARTLDRSRRRREMMDKDNEEILGNRASEDYQQRTASRTRGQYARMRGRRQDSHSMHERSAIYKQSLDTAAEEHWAHELGSSSYLQGIKRSSHIQSGEAKVITDRLEAGNERALEESINRSNHLTAMKMDAIRDRGMAKINLAEVEARGNEQLQTAIIGDRGLRKAIVATTELQNRAGIMEQDVKDRAAAHWNDVSKKDPGLQELRLKAVQSSERSKLTEASWNTFIENVRSGGSIDPNIKTAQSKAIAESIKKVGLDTQVQTFAQDSSKEVFQSELSRYLENDAVIERAVGIGGEKAKIRVAAKAKSLASNAVVEAVKNIENTQDWIVSTDADGLLQRFKQPDTTVEQRIAIAKAMSRAGGPGHKALLDSLDFLDKNYSPSDDEVQLFKEIVMTSSDAAGSNKAIEFWLTNATDTGGSIRSIGDLMNDTGTWSNISVAAFSKMNQVAQNKLLSVLATSNPALYDTLVEGVKESQSKENVKTGIRQTLGRDASDSSWHSPPPGSLY